MIHLTAQSHVMLSLKPTDFRKQFDGLIRVCVEQLKQNPRSGIRFVFINRAKTMIRILAFDGSGYWLATKRLSRGKFSAWPRRRSDTLSDIDAKALLEILQQHDCKIPSDQASYHTINEDDDEQ